MKNHIVDSLSAKYPARLLQSRQLYALLDPELASPPNIIVYGLESTGKSLVTKALLEQTGLSFSWIACDECITVRHLTERIASCCREDVLARAERGTDKGDKGGDVAGLQVGRCENVNGLVVFLGKLLKGREKKHVLVLDRIDRQREASVTLLAALARLGEMIKNLTVIFIVSAPAPRYLSMSDTPHIHFPPYTKEESILILSKEPRRIQPESLSNDGSEEEYTEEMATEDLFVWTRFLNTVWETLAKSVARDIVRFRETADKMWEEFTEPIRAGEYGTRNFSSLYVLKKDMFRTEDSITDLVVLQRKEAQGLPTAKSTHELPYYSKYLLFASYLASYNSPRQDALYFMKSTERKRRRRGGVNAGRKAQQRKIHRRLIGPQPFQLERMLAIFRAILEHPVPASSVDIQTQVATLANLRLLIKTSAGSDPLESTVKWRINVGWEYINMLARSVKFEIQNYLAE